MKSVSSPIPGSLARDYSAWLTAAAAVALQLAGVVIAGAATSGAAGWLAAGLVVLGTAVWVWLQWKAIVLRALIADVGGILRSATGKQVDISRRLPEQGPRDAQELAALFNCFMERMRGLMDEQQQHSLRLGLAAAHGRLLTEKASRDAGRQEEASELVFRSSDETAKAIAEISKRTSAVAAVNSRNLDAVRHSSQELQRVSGQIETVTTTMREFGQTVESLVTSSEDIRTILGTVQSFAAQTNMLALNAAIEAARAGEHGRGFAVVADEVRELAGKVRGATDQISGLVEAMTSAVSRTAEGTNDVIGHAEQARAAVTASAGQFDGMLKDFETNHDDLLLVSSSIEELSVTNREGHERSTEIRDLGSRIRADMEKSFAHADTLRDTTNLSLQGLSRFRIGRGQFEPIVDLLLARRDTMQRELEQLMDRGVDLFDRNYRPFPQSKRHFETSYIRALREACQGMIDDWCQQDRERVLYWVPVDERGYIALARSEYSQTPTGDPRVDMVNSQALTFTVANEVELNNLKKAEYVSLGTFVIGKGKVVFAVFAPLAPHGRRWGTLTIGVAPQAFGIS